MKGKVLFHTKYSEYLREDTHLFDALEFLAELTQHISPWRVQLIRRYRLYSSLTKDAGPRCPMSLPERWRESHAPEALAPEDPGFEPLDDGEQVAVNARKRAWARLLAKVYEIDPMVCPKCRSEYEVQFRARVTAGSSAWPKRSYLPSFRTRLRYATSSPTWQRPAVRPPDSIRPC